MSSPDPSMADDSSNPLRRRTRRSSGTWQATQPVLVQSPQIDVETLQEHFHLPITEVAKKLGVCATVLKKICRKYGISRWPHRKIKSLDKTIASLEASKSKSPAQQAKIQEELESARNQKEQLIHNPSSSAPPKTIKSRRRERMSFRGMDVSDDDSFESEELSSTSETYHSTRGYSRSSSVSAETSPRGITPRGRAVSVSGATGTVAALPAVSHVTPRIIPPATQTRVATTVHKRAYSIPSSTKAMPPSAHTCRVPRVSALAKIHDSAMDTSESSTPTPTSAFSAQRHTVHGPSNGVPPAPFLFSPPFGVPGAPGMSPFYPGPIGQYPMGFPYGWPQHGALGPMPPHLSSSIPLSSQQHQQQQLFQAQQKETSASAMEGVTNGGTGAVTSANTANSNAQAPSGTQSTSTSHQPPHMQAPTMPGVSSKPGQPAPFMYPMHPGFFPGYPGSYFPMAQAGSTDQPALSRYMTSHPHFFMWANQQVAYQQQAIQQQQQSQQNGSGKVVVSFPSTSSQAPPHCASAPPAPNHMSDILIPGMESLLKLAETAELGGESETAEATTSSAMDVSDEASPRTLTALHGATATASEKSYSTSGLPTPHGKTEAAQDHGGGESSLHVASEESSSSPHSDNQSPALKKSSSTNISKEDASTSSETMAVS